MEGHFLVVEDRMNPLDVVLEIVVLVARQCLILPGLCLIVFCSRLLVVHNDRQGRGLWFEEGE